MKTVRQRTGRNVTIDALKGICIIFIIITHANFSAYDRELKYYFPFWIDMAVPVFMLISGYVGAHSLERKKKETLESSYVGAELLIKWCRFLLPYTIIFLFQITLEIVTGVGNLESFAPRKIIDFYFGGGGGPGSYYVPMMLQFVIVFPVIFFFLKRNGFFGLIIIIGINLLYEDMMYTCSSYPVFRLIVLRHIGIISIGAFSYMYKGKKVRLAFALVITLVGLLFIVLEDYCAKRFLIHYFEPRTSLIASFYAIPFVIKIIGGDRLKQLRVLGAIGESSFEIYCFQMLYYGYIVKLFSGLMNVSLLQLLANVTICVAVGMVLHLILTPFYRKVSDELKKMNVVKIKDSINDAFSGIMYKE